MAPERPKTPSWAFWHLVWPKIEEDRLPGSSPSSLLSLDRQNAPLLAQPSPHAHLCGKTQHRAQPHNRYKLSNGYVLALNHQGPWAHGHHMTARNATGFRFKPYI
jgi:hypothetical protein